MVRKEVRQDIRDHTTGTPGPKAVTLMAKAMIAV